MAKRQYGGGVIEQRGPGVFRLRYAINGERFSRTITGTKAEAKVKLRELLKSGDDGAHVAPNKITVGEWIDQWLASGAPGQRQKAVSQNTLERYTSLMNVHIKPVLGKRPLQQLRSTDADATFAALDPAAVDGLVRDGLLRRPDRWRANPEATR